MTIKLYKTSSAPNKIHKSLTEVRDADGYLRDQCSLMKPVITFSSSAMNTFNDVNYMYIPAFERYYFVNSVTSVASGLIEVSGTIDPLYTYRTAIMSSTVVLNRTSNSDNYSRMIPDEQMRLKTTKKKLQLITFGSDGYPTVDANTSTSHGWTTVLITAGVGQVVANGDTSS